MKILLTGAAGFIGYHVCERLVALGHSVVGLDNLNQYYDVNLKIARLKQLGVTPGEINEVITSSLHGENFKFIKLDLEDRENLPKLFENEKFDQVCNLAAQAGVRYSLENPFTYVDSNILGFINILEACRNYSVKKLVYASSSSVYGLNKNIPFSTKDAVDNPISLYAATKKCNELMAYTYSHLFGINTIGLRFFTVYGPWGRPDMAMYLFTNSILNGTPLKVFNNGDLWRDFTYIDDIVDGVLLAMFEHSDVEPMYRLYNIGNSKPVKLMDFITEIENFTGKEAIKEYLPMQPGDVEKTWADVTEFSEMVGFQPSTDIKTGIANFVKWFVQYYRK